MALIEYLNYQTVADHGWKLDDEDLFEKASEADLSELDYGFLDVSHGEYILEGSEADGYDWPFSCRNGLCSNCAVILKEGEIEMDGNQVLTTEEIEQKNVRLTCVGRPASGFIRIIYNAKYLDYLQDRVM